MARKLCSQRELLHLAGKAVKLSWPLAFSGQGKEVIWTLDLIAVSPPSKLGGCAHLKIMWKGIRVDTWRVQISGLTGSGAWGKTFHAQHCSNLCVCVCVCARVRMN
jgi:hypothetical protein